jgi:hypothetical protein
MVQQLWRHAFVLAAPVSATCAEAAAEAATGTLLVPRPLVGSYFALLLLLFGLLFRPF